MSHEDILSINRRHRSDLQNNYQHTSVRGRLHSIMGNARLRSKRHEKLFDLTIDFLLDLYAKQSGACALTGIKFVFEKPNKFMRNPYAMSLDRVDSSKGYTIDNVRLVLTSVNFALNEFGEDCFDNIATAYLKRLMEEEVVFTKVGQTFWNPEKRSCVRIFEFGKVDCTTVCPRGRDAKRCGFHCFCEGCERRFECATERNS
jgi:hypothetical protein